MNSSFGELVYKEEEREWRRKMLEQQENWQKEVVVTLLKQLNQLISLLAKNYSEAE